MFPVIFFGVLIFAAAQRTAAPSVSIGKQACKARQRAFQKRVPEMEQRLSLITLGVKDMEKSCTFYTALGWKRTDSPDKVVAFDLIGQTLCLYPRTKLMEDMGLSAQEHGSNGVFSGVTLGYNTREKKDVAEVLRKVAAAGGKVLKGAEDVFWGGHHGFFADVDGHIWEVAHNPFSSLRTDGAFKWNGYSSDTEKEKSSL